MSGRRRYPRYVMTNSVGTLRVLSDVTVHQDARGDLISISDQPRKCGEVLTFEPANGLGRTVVRVAEVRPIVDGGAIWHWARLVLLELEGHSSTGGPTGARLDTETR